MKDDTLFSIGSILFNITTFPTVMRLKREQRAADREKQKALNKELSKIKSHDDVNNYLTEKLNKVKGKVNLDEMKRTTVEAYLDNLDRMDQGRDYANVRVIKKILARAKKDVGGLTANVDTTLQKEIDSLQRMSDRYRYTCRAEEANDWINYAIWVSTNPRAIGIVKVDESIKEFVNGVCKFLHVDLQYPMSAVADLEFYDPIKNGFNEQPFLINTEALSKLCTINFLAKVNMKNNPPVPATAATQETVDLNKTIPFHFAEPNEHNTLIDPSMAIDDYMQAVLDQAIVPFLNEREHWYSKANEPNTYTLYVRNPNNGIAEEYKLVVGYHGYNVVSIVTTNMLGMRVVVNTMATELCNRILSNCFYQVSDVDTNEAAKYQSEYFWIYDLIDFTSIRQEEIMISRLDQKLNIVFGALQANGITFSSRFRFERYQNVHSFILASDDYVISPFGGSNDGSIIIVNNNEACYKDNNNKFVTVTF